MRNIAKNELMSFYVILTRYWSPCDEDAISPYTNIIVPQLLERRFLKSLWKTIYDFRRFMEEQVKDDMIRKYVIANLGAANPDYRIYIVNELRKRCDLSLGEIFIIPRSNKFYSLSPGTVFTVYINGGEKKIDTLLLQKDYSKLYNKVAFYVFCKEDAISSVRENFIQLINEPFPTEEEIKDIGTQLKWEM